MNRELRPLHYRVADKMYKNSGADAVEPITEYEAYYEKHDKDFAEFKKKIILDKDRYGKPTDKKTVREGKYHTRFWSQEKKSERN
jgi:hypothetical protein